MELSQEVLEPPHSSAKQDIFSTSEQTTRLDQPVCLVDVMAELDRRCNVFDHYHMDEVFQFFGLVVHRDNRRRGIGKKLMRAAVFFVQNLDVGDVVIKGTASSNISQRLYEKFGFEMLSKMTYDDYKFEGEHVLSDTGENKTQKLYGMRVNIMPIDS